MRCGSQTGQSNVNFSPASVSVVPYAHFGGSVVSTPTKAARHLITARRASCGAHPLHPVHSHVCDRIKNTLLSVACPRSAMHERNHSRGMESGATTGRCQHRATLQSHSRRVVGDTRFERVTSSLSGTRSNQLS